MYKASFKIPQYPYDGDTFCICVLQDTGEITLSQTSYILYNYQPEGSNTKIYYNGKLWDPNDIIPLTLNGHCSQRVEQYFIYIKTIDTWICYWQMYPCDPTPQIPPDSPPPASNTVRVIIRFFDTEGGYDYVYGHDLFNGVDMYLIHEDIFDVVKGNIFYHQYDNKFIYDLYTTHGSSRKTLTINDLLQKLEDTTLSRTPPKGRSYFYESNLELICTENTVDGEIKTDFPFETGYYGTFFYFEYHINHSTYQLYPHDFFSHVLQPGDNSQYSIVSDISDDTIEYIENFLKIENSNDNLDLIIDFINTFNLYYSSYSSYDYVNIAYHSESGFNNNYYKTSRKIYSQESDFLDIFPTLNQSKLLPLSVKNTISWEEDVWSTIFGYRYNNEIFPVDKNTLPETSIIVDTEPLYDDPTYRNRNHAYYMKPFYMTSEYNMWIANGLYTLTAWELQVHNRLPAFYSGNLSPIQSIEPKGVHFLFLIDEIFKYDAASGRYTFDCNIQRFNPVYKCNKVTWSDGSLYADYSNLDFYYPLSLYCDFYIRVEEYLEDTNVARKLNFTFRCPPEYKPQIDFKPMMYLGDNGRHITPSELTYHIVYTKNWALTFKDIRTDSPYISNIDNVKYHGCYQNVAAWWGQISDDFTMDATFPVDKRDWGNYRIKTDTITLSETRDLTINRNKIPKITIYDASSLKEAIENLENTYTTFVFTPTGDETIINIFPKQMDEYYYADV